MTSDHQLRHLPSPFLTLDLPDETSTNSLANDLAMTLRAGDVVCLSGDLGAGKSTLSRALLRHHAAEPELEVPSPTFTLVQTYELPRFDISHFDLYRLEDPEELEELGLDDLLVDGAALIEWPEKAEDLLPDNALWIQLSQPDDSSDKRQVCFSSADAEWVKRIHGTLEIRQFLDLHVAGSAPRTYLAGDASLRSFEAVVGPTQQAVLMRWPFAADQLPESIRTYMDKVHLARDCRSVLAISQGLRERGFHAPEIYAADLKRGLVLSEDLGDATIVEDGKPVEERYVAAVEVLADMHSRDWPEEIILEGGNRYRLQNYSDEALIAEASLFLEWYLPFKSGTPVSNEMKEEFRNHWASQLSEIGDTQRGWVLRDYHSPNLMWLAAKKGTDRIGLIDFQDTVIGPVAYDVASLLLDARTEIHRDLEKKLFETYVSSRQEQSSDFDRVEFSKAYAVMAAQRISKILGIFVRLAERDNKPAYLRHLPRMESYLARAFEAEILFDLKDWYQRHMS